MFVFCLAAGAAFAACSGETTENPGGDGGSGASGSAGTTSSTTGASTTGASTSSTTAATSSGAGGDGGGATVCEQACDKADECGLPVCDALPFDCADPAAECSAQCVVGATCEQLESLEEGPADQELTDCLNECQGSEGGSAVACLSCANQNGCMDACSDDISCQLWLLCALGCMRNDPQPQCFSGCNADYVGTPTEEMIDAVYACTCTDCNESCNSAVDPCNQ
ncbi:hypothetical protein [Sorangium sp. So ce145]|uniref:hypothetical protein n=1 Tax=Sorangium sp. So ce145 TaxID=3133285 RepID=UPI003F62986D